VFVHRNSAGTPELGMVLELDGGRLTTRTCGTFKVVE
jgi:hypothetical protein